MKHRGDIASAMGVELRSSGGRRRKPGPPIGRAILSLLFWALLIGSGLGAMIGTVMQ